MATRYPFTGSEPCNHPQVDGDLFFPIHEHDPQVRHITAQLCGPCPARAACLDWAVTNGEVGIWANTSTRQRQRLRERAGLPKYGRKAARPDLLAERRDMIRRLHAAGHNDTDIATRLGVTPNAVKSVRRRARETAGGGTAA